MVDQDIQSGVTKARAAQRRSLEALDEDILSARKLLREGKFKNDLEEARALKTLADLLEQRAHINRRIKE